MKRFITYLYECEKGNKIKNVGFIRVNIRGEETTLDTYIRSHSHGNDTGKIYLLINKEDLLGIELGEIKVESGQSESCFYVQSEDIQNSGFSINNIEGVAMCFDSGGYIASCWKDALADQIVKGEFQDRRLCGNEVHKEENQTKLEVEVTTDLSNALTAAEDVGVSVLRDEQQEMKKEKSVTYEKIDLAQIRDLPSPNWHLSTNSFLLHGFANYGYLVLKKVLEEGKETLSLGVPGVFEKPEAVMAILFGFPTFEEIPKKMNQETKVGTFGGWFVKLKV